MHKTLGSISSTTHTHKAKKQQELFARHRGPQSADSKAGSQIIGALWRKAVHLMVARKQFTKAVVRRGDRSCEFSDQHAVVFQKDELGE